MQPSFASECVVLFGGAAERGERKNHPCALLHHQILSDTAKTTHRKTAQILRTPAALTRETVAQKRASD